MITHFLHKGPVNTRACLYPALSQTWILSTMWTDCPVNIAEEIARLWIEKELDTKQAFYFEWVKDWYDEEYPVIAEFLGSKGIDDCLIHHW